MLTPNPNECNSTTMSETRDINLTQRNHYPVQKLLLFGMKNNQLHNYSLFLQNDTEVLDLPMFLLLQPIWLDFVSYSEKFKSLSMYDLLPPK